MLARGLTSLREVRLQCWPFGWCVCVCVRARVHTPGGQAASTSSSPAAADPSFAEDIGVLCSLLSGACLCLLLDGVAVACAIQM